MASLILSFENYLKSKPLQETVKRGYTRDICRLAEWHNREIDSFSLDEMQKKYAELSDTYSTNLAFKTFRALRMVLYFAQASQDAIKAVLRRKHKRGQTTDARYRCPMPRHRCTKPIDDLPHWYSMVRTARSTAVSHFLLTLLFTGLPWRIVRELRWSSVDLANHTFIIDGQPVYLPDVVYSMLLARRKSSTFVFERSRGQRMGVRCKSSVKHVRVAFSQTAATHNLARRNIGLAPGQPLTRAESERVVTELLRLSNSSSS